MEDACYWGLCDTVHPHGRADLVGGGGGRVNGPGGGGGGGGGVMGQDVALDMYFRLGG